MDEERIVTCHKLKNHLNTLPAPIKYPRNPLILLQQPFISLSNLIALLRQPFSALRRCVVVQQQASITLSIVIVTLLSPFCGLRRQIADVIFIINHLRNHLVMLKPSRSSYLNLVVILLLYSKLSHRYCRKYHRV